MLKNFTVIEGNIGSGKTTLCKLLAQEYSANIILEEFEENPFLSEFLTDQKTNSLGVELQFLIDRYYQLKNTEYKSDITIADYFIENQNKKPTKITTKENEILLNMYQKNNNFKFLIERFDLTNLNGSDINF